jgi:hypothetical protein
MDREKSKVNLQKLKRYRCKNKKEKLFLQCQEIGARFITKEHLQECYHRMSSQKNKAMNKSIMRYTPKDRTYAQASIWLLASAVWGTVNNMRD